ncbi:hypothetical protein E1B28_005358 [Marasmius oreades]|uniref:DUF6535 domain-containing protein n=1 Tax=Marasmius oreades TaxID=181124 RepID=A0A9P7S328_9AGAR|nr:uncharacterized protein E1B28_005358 [Marasmius oreades]KAG7094529.1 hypothetical protein E1B28_005358 [Marasmius oreades]
MASSDNSQGTHAANPEFTTRESWKVIMKTVDTLDEDLVKGYKEDIDTLLVFAGLFSAVVTAFTVESYQWLEEDPADITVELLTQIVQQLSGQTPPPRSPLQKFTPSASVVRINTFWFLSLTLALVDALFGLLCKQWVREHQRQTNTLTRTPGQALALRWLRYQSFERWHVPKILSSLPILLEMALFLFFAGLLELLWTRHHIPFTIALAILGLALLFYLLTTILPGLSMIRQVVRIHPSFARGNPVFYPFGISHLPSIDFICPYKSPQSWLIFRLFSAMFHVPGCKQLLRYFIIKINRYWKDYPSTLDDTLTKNTLNLSNWLSLDLNVIQRFSRIEGCPDLYEFKGFRWLVQETRDIPSMIPHLRNVLAELPVHLVMPAVFDRWGSPVGKPSYAAADIDYALRSSHGSDVNLFGDQSSAHDLSLAGQILYFRNWLSTYGGYELGEAAAELWNRILRAPRNIRFINAFFRPEELLLGPPRYRCGKILSFFGQHWDDLDVEYQARVAERLSRSILPFLESPEHDTGPTLLTSGYGLDFFTAVNDQLCQTKDFFEWRYRAEPWMYVLSHVRRIHQLPPHHFKPLPGYLPIPSDELNTLLNDSSASKSVFEPLFDSYKHCWDNVVSTYRKKELVKTLSNHIYQFIPVSSSNPPRLPDGSRSLYKPPSVTTTSVFLTSDSGLEFLTFVNGKLAADVDFHDTLMSDTVQPWVDALEHIQVLHRLPSKYFKPIPTRHWSTREIVGFYRPRNPSRQIQIELEAGESLDVFKTKSLTSSASNIVVDQGNHKVIEEMKQDTGNLAIRQHKAEDVDQELGELNAANNV